MAKVEYVLTKNLLKAIRRIVARCRTYYIICETSKAINLLNAAHACLRGWQSKSIATTLQLPSPWQIVANWSTLVLGGHLASAPPDLGQ